VRDSSRRFPSWIYEDVSRKRGEEDSAKGSGREGRKGKREEKRYRNEMMK